MILAEPHLPVFWGHGEADPEIPIAYAEDAISFLYYRLRVPRSILQFRSYEDLQHTINDDELDDLTTWLVWILG